MKNIKEVRQAYEKVKTQVLNTFLNANFCEMKDLELLDQFITDIEQVMNTPICENCEPTDLETAKQKLRLMASECNRYNDRQNQIIEKLQDECDDLRKENEELKSKSLHDSQVIEPNVLEKIDKLEKENEQYRNSNKQVYEKLKKTIKQLAITDKALDKAIEMFIKNNENKCPIAEKDCEETLWEYKGKKHNCNECLKDYLLKESENTDEQENTN